MTKWQKIYVAMLLAALASFASADDTIANGLFKFHHDLATQGDPQSMYLLGNMYASGRGVARSYDEAVHWYERAMEHGNSRAMGRIAELVIKRQEEEQELLQLKAQLKEQLREEQHLQREQSDSGETHESTPLVSGTSTTQKTATQASTKKQSSTKSSAKPAIKSSGKSIEKSTVSNKEKARGWVETKQPDNVRQTNRQTKSAGLTNPKNALPSEKAAAVAAPLGLGSAGLSQRKDSSAKRRDTQPQASRETVEDLWFGTEAPQSDTGSNKSLGADGAGNTARLQSDPRIGVDNSAAPETHIMTPNPDATIEEAGNYVAHEPKKADAGFKANPCSGAAARFMSTCN